MKKILLITLFCVCVFACQTAENTNIGNKNTNANYNQNSELQKLRNQLKQQGDSHQKDINTVQQQIEQSNSNVENLNNQVNREKLHQVEPEAR